jgi:hypothetical protein
VLPIKLAERVEPCCIPHFVRSTAAMTVVPRPAHSSGLVDPHFEPVPRQAGCPHCEAGAPAGSGRFFDNVYCISLQEEPEQYARLCEHLHAIGLCAGTTVYRARRTHEAAMGCWDSHKRVAICSIERGDHRALIVEDDAQLTTSWPRVVARLSIAFADLPEDWRTIWLGHKPFRGYFAGRRLLRTMSYLTHCYIANRPHLEWLANSNPGDPRIPSTHPSYDAATRVMVGAYALFPMVARQRLTSVRPAPRRFGGTTLYTMLTNLALCRPLEIFCVLTSPVQRRFFPMGSPETYPFVLDTPLARDARLIHDSGLFDPTWYLQTYPDVTMDPLRHYMWDGAREDRKPNPEFEPVTHKEMHRDVDWTKQNPLADFIRRRGGET